MANRNHVLGSVPLHHNQQTATVLNVSIVPAHGSAVTRRPRPPASDQDQAVPDDDLQIVFGRNFRKARLDAGLSQSQAAEQSGINQSNISLAEAGRLNATIRTMSALARVVGKPVSDLLTPSPPRRRKK